jgi:hypothetical protein
MDRGDFFVFYALSKSYFSRENLTETKQKWYGKILMVALYLSHWNGFIKKPLILQHHSIVLSWNLLLALFYSGQKLRQKVQFIIVASIY